MLVCLKGTVLVLKGVSLGVASANRPSLLKWAYSCDDTVFRMGEGNICFRVGEGNICPWWMFSVNISFLPFCKSAPAGALYCVEEVAETPLLGQFPFS